MLVHYRDSYAEKSSGSSITHGSDANHPYRVTLILHPKWFYYDVTAGSVGKVGKQVLFTPELEVGSGMTLTTVATSFVDDIL
ncbi:hypothetical protein BDN67DRAFT_972757 [Paxillus ammoniavirescens]|nr:hypothetical protein BDN67DRAFT_972757 [Paxillus ammoniavirescens]